MKNRAASGIMLTLLLIGMLTLAFNIQPVRASGTIYIRPDGSIDPPTAPIQRDGDLYTLTGNITSDTCGIQIQRNNMTLDGAGYKVQGTGVETGIHLSWRNNVTIKNVEIKSFENAIWFQGSSENSIVENTIADNTERGIMLSDSPSNSIWGNNLTTNNWGGICLYWSSHNSIFGNNVVNSGPGIYLHESSNNNISENNITESDSPAIYFEDSSNNTISENNITSNSYDGILLGMSSNNSISRNSITANDRFGIYLYRSSDSNVSRNNLTNNNCYGIYLEESSDNSMSENNIAANKYGGIVQIWFSNQNNISGNTIINDSNGIYIDTSSNNTIFCNNIEKNKYGICLYYSSNYNIVFGNNITNNLNGVRLASSSLDNTFYHNNFVSNTQQVVSYDLMNFWDNGYPSGGNYWSDYSINYPAVGDEYQGENQSVVGSDGIWDHPYEIDAGNLDNYPLVEPWTPVERKAGVKIGDWVKYGNFDVAWSSDDPDSEIPVGMAILSQTEWLENSVETIQGAKIKYQQLLHFKNGSEYSTTCWIDIGTGSGTALTFISSGLVPDDCIYASAPWFAWKLNETTFRQYISVPREVNCLNITTSMQFGPPPAYPNSTGNFYWDRETGVLCELSMKHLNQTGSYVTSWSVFYEIVDTNLWEAPNPAEETQELIETIETWNLHKGVQNSLTAKLEGAIHLLNIGNENGAIHKLMDFINQVEAQRDKKLVDGKAEYLISEAQRIIELIKG